VLKNYIIGIKNVMILKKIFIGLFCLNLLTGCAQNFALFGPAYTLASSGSVYQAGLTYGSNEAITKATGRSTSENIKKILKKDEEDTEFRKLVKKRIEKNRKKLDLSNQ